MMTPEFFDKLKPLLINLRQAINNALYNSSGISVAMEAIKDAGCDVYFGTSAVKAMVNGCHNVHLPTDVHFSMMISCLIDEMGKEQQLQFEPKKLVENSELVSGIFSEEDFKFLRSVGSSLDSPDD